MEFSLAALKIELVILAKLFVAGCLGAMIGFERERSDKAAGFRTHIIVAMTAAMFVSLANIWVHLEPEAGTALRIDPIRAVEAIAVGVGFLGSGMVFFSDSRPRGLTTAASIWATSAIGVACGFARFVLAIGAAIMVLIALRALLRLEPSSKGEPHASR